MAKLKRDGIVSEALILLEEVGLDGLTMRQLAQRLGVASPTLYWHFRDKAALLAEMAAAALAEHRAKPILSDIDGWIDWFADNARSLRNALSAHRDGAKLHAGTAPGRDDLILLADKVAFLERAGFTRPDALMGLLAVGRYTLGCVLEDQARLTPSGPRPRISEASDASVPSDVAAAVVEVLSSDGDGAFEFGLALIVAGLRDQARADRDPKRSVPGRRRCRTPLASAGPS